MKAEEMKQEFVMKYRLIAFDKDGKRRCNEEEMLVGIDKICDAVIAERSPSNEQIHAAALAWARDHSEAPDKDCPTWLIRDYEAGAYFVRQCYGCWNKTDKMVSERLGNQPLLKKIFNRLNDIDPDLLASIMDQIEREGSHD